MRSWKGNVSPSTHCFYNGLTQRSINSFLRVRRTMQETGVGAPLFSTMVRLRVVAAT